MWNRLRDTSKKIVLYGTGNACERIMKLMEERGLRASAVFASDDFVRDRTFRGYKVESYSAVKERFGAENMIVLLCFGTHRPEVVENIERISGETELLAPDIAVIPEYGADGREILFDAECKEAHSAEIERVREMLSDELSRQLFDNVISYRLSGELSYLKRSETPEKDIWEEAVSFAGAAEKERIGLLDLGAYTGDTAELFTSVLRGKTARITAVEADDRNYRKLREKYAENDDFELIHAAAGRNDGTVMFSQGGGRGSLQKKKREIPMVCIDSICKNDPPDIIKFDIEGMEADALKGGREFITEHAPVMIVSAYHKVYDMWELPLLVKSFRPDYRVFLRRSPCVPNWGLDLLFTL